MSATAPRRNTKTYAVADLFAGAGGSSTGARRAIEARGDRLSLVCVNHWDVAVATHAANHPDARHYCQDIATLRPQAAVPDGRLDLLMASPTCTHHSRARGGRPTSDQQRQDPWHVVSWLTELRVRALLVENVPEFVSWGPCSARTNRPLKSRQGEYFQAWTNVLRSLGYEVEWRVLNAADYGAATSRERFFLIARSDGRRIVWPQPTHGPAGVDGLFSPLAPYRTARDVIDWTHEGRSIFGRRRPLAAKTIARIRAGAVREGWPRVFLAALDRLVGRDDVAGDEEMTAEPVALTIGQHGGAVARSVARELATITTDGAISLVEPVIAPYYGSGSGQTTRSVARPLPTITTKARFGLVEPVIVAHFGERSGQAPRVHSVDEPVPTITSRGGGELVSGSLCAPASDDVWARAVAERRACLIDGRPAIVDIRFRMLEPRELARAMGFSDDETAYEFTGTKTDVLRQIGNAVPVDVARALVDTILYG